MKKHYMQPDEKKSEKTTIAATQEMGESSEDHCRSEEPPEDHSRDEEEFANTWR